MELTVEQLEQILKTHRQFFQAEHTKSISFRIQALKSLKKSIQNNEQKIIAALQADLGKNEFEAYTTEIGFTLSSIREQIKHLKKWAKPQKVKTPIYLMPAKEYIMREPYGTVLIIGPYNYPFQLVIEPLIGAIAAGNCVVIKPSELTPHVSSVVTKMISETFPSAFVRSIEGGIETNRLLSSAAFDYIFFTGSVPVGKIIMKAASEHLTPITLELGGKSPVIVDETANISVAAERIVWGKTLNAGQTCIAPDYVWVHETQKKALVQAMIKSLKAFYGEEIEKSKDFGRIVNERHFNRIKALIEKDQEGLLFGGKTNRKSFYIEPTLIEISSLEAATMSEEIFGPVLPIMTYTDLNEVIRMIRRQPKPLALYLFSEDKQIQKKVLSEISSGGACINETIMHSVNSKLPFGGVGHSGMGSYHGKYSFETFSHQKSVFERPTKLQLKMLFPPYGAKKLQLIKRFMK